MGAGYGGRPGSSRAATGRALRRESRAPQGRFLTISHEGTSMKAANPGAGRATEVDSYQVVDRFFGKPCIDRDEWRETPYPHRNIHGGFADCDTRFTFHCPPASGYQSPMFQPSEGAHAGPADAFGGRQGS